MTIWRFTNSVVLNVDGASVRVDNPTGIRFRSQFGKGLIDSLRTTCGEENVNIGMIITPTDYLTGNDVEFEMAALDECSAITGAKYVKITATAIHENELFYVINCALVNVHTENYNRKFSARAFIEVNGEVYKYAEFDMEDNSRSIAYVAERAYNDAKATQDSIYKNEITLDIGTTAYSPYSPAERASLKNFFKDYAAPSITVMTYNIRTAEEEENFWGTVTGHNWEGRDINVAMSTVLNSGVDVIGFQEDDKYLDEYLKQLKSKYTRVNGDDNGKGAGNGDENNEIVFKTGEFELVDSGTVYYKNLKDNNTYKSYISGIPSKYELSDSVNTIFGRDKQGENDEGRFFRWVILEKDGVQFLVVNTHLHYRKDSKDDTANDANKALREMQATLLRAWLVESTEGKSCSNQIVMGDLNSVATAKEFAGLTTGDGALDQAMSDASYKGDTYGTLINNNETYDHDDNPETDEVANPNRFKARQKWVFDHILYNGDSLTAAEYSIIDNKNDQNNTAYPSDHLPVVAKFIAK